MQVLVIGHDAYRAGAQIELLHILRWLKTAGVIPTTVVLRAGGDLLPEFQTIAPTELWTPTHLVEQTWSDSLLDDGPRRIERRFRRHLARLALFRRLRGMQPDIIYVNSVASLAILSDITRRVHCPVVCHVHELELMLRRSCGLAQFRRAAADIEGYIAVSDAVRRNLVAGHGIDPNRITVIHGGVPIPSDSVPVNIEAKRQRRQEIGVPDDAFVVGGCGMLNWLKAPEVFIQVAAELARQQPERPAHFVWVGGGTAEGAFDMVQHDIDRLGLNGRVHFVGVQAAPRQFFEMFDVFLLSSREDSFPLVCLEAAALEIPIVCFRDAGGMPEFVADDAGFAVPYLDTREAAARIMSLLTSEGRRQALGRRAREKVLTCHNMDVIGGQVVAVLAQLARRKGLRVDSR